MSISEFESCYEQGSSPLPNFSSHGYQVVQQLGHNEVGDHTTYLATQTATGQAVVIKQFAFGCPGANWSGFKAYEREIEVLHSLNHPGIPRYLDCFETHNSFCLLQEYKEAEPLAVPRSFTTEEIKQIAVSVLEILVYLQNLVPPVTHRDIKPGNVLIDEWSNVVASVHKVISEYNRLGTATIETPGKGGRRNYYLSWIHEKEFLADFFKKAASGQIATAAEIKLAYEKLVGHTVHKTTIYRLLDRHQWRKIVPRPSHVKADKQKQEAFKKTFNPQSNNS